MIHIFLSPHIDDAIGSSGGMMAKYAAYQQPVHILNIFSGHASPPFSDFAKKLHRLWGNPMNVTQTRRAEEAAATKRINAVVHFGDALDAIYRKDHAGKWFYPWEQELFESPNEQDNNDQIRECLNRLKSISCIGDCRIYAPLGIGNHVDHQIVFNCGLELIKQGYSVFFYEDFPYARNDSTYQERICKLAGWTSYDVEIGENDLHAKIAAYSRYHSQIKFLFSNEIEMIFAVKKFAQTQAGHNMKFGEKLWSPRKANETVME